MFVVQAVKADSWLFRKIVEAVHFQKPNDLLDLSFFNLLNSFWITQLILNNYIIINYYYEFSIICLLCFEGFGAMNNINNSAAPPANAFVSDNAFNSVFGSADQPSTAAPGELYII